MHLCVEIKTDFMRKVEVMPMKTLCRNRMVGIKSCLLQMLSLFLLVAQSFGGQEGDLVSGTQSSSSKDGQLLVSHVKPRLIVLTDLSNEPDDEESFVRLLVYSDQYDIEGLIATTSNWLKEKPREDLIRRDLAAYGEVWPNLVKHSPDFPRMDSLLSVTQTGQNNLGMADVGAGKSSNGSKRIIEAVDRSDDRPIWIAIWGGPNTLAQALWDVRASRTPSEVEKFVARIRVYAISDQDDSGAWIRREFKTCSTSSPHPIRPVTRNTIARPGRASPADGVIRLHPAIILIWWITPGSKPTSSRITAHLARFIRASNTSWKAIRPAFWG